MKSISIGEISLRLLDDAMIELGGDNVFSPAKQEEWEQIVTADGLGRIKAAVRSLLITDRDEHSLVDTGFGEVESRDRATSVIGELAALGVSENQISRVIITHAHGDHCLGNTVMRDGRWHPAFPAATYYLQEREAATLRQTSAALWRSSFEPLAQAGKLRLLEGDTDITSGIACRSTPGHTIGHQSVLIRSRGETALFVGDLAIVAANMEHPNWGPDWAWSREVDRKSRIEIAEWASDHAAVLIIGHDPLSPLVRLRRNDGSFQAIALRNTG